MKLSKSLIIKVAFFISIAAFLFSLVTLIRNIVIGAMVFLGILQVVGSAVIVLVCYVLMRAYRDESDPEETEDNHKEKRTRIISTSESDSGREDEKEASFDFLIESAEQEEPDDLPSDYDISLFEEE